MAASWQPSEGTLVSSRGSDVRGSVRLCDRLLDQGSTGPLYLGVDEIARIVEEHLLKTEVMGTCSVHAFAIMPNHVHVLWTPAISLPDLVRSVKGPTATYCNRILEKRGDPFWQAEYFDRIMRNQEEFEKTKNYIEWNPVRAQLASTPEEFRWSSAFRNGGRPLGRVGRKPRLACEVDFCVEP